MYKEAVFWRKARLAGTAPRHGAFSANGAITRRDTGHGPPRGLLP
jgi:hypothetical protein